MARLRRELDDALHEQQELHAPPALPALPPIEYIVDVLDDAEYLPEPFWDNSDSVFRCIVCRGEVEEGKCTFCQELHAYDSVSTVPRRPRHLLTGAQDEDDDENDASLAVLDAALSTARFPGPRGTTPLLDDDDDVVPSTFPWRPEAFRALLQRGATRATIERYRME